MTEKEQTEAVRQAYTTPRPDVFGMVPYAAIAILDVGCSNGALGASLKFAQSGRRVCGIEMDADFALEAGTRIDRVICSDLNQFDWNVFANDTKFDCIIFADILEHLIDPEKHLKAARRFLQPGGCLVISLPNIRHISSFYSIFIKGTFPARDRGIFDRTHLRWFTIKDANRLLSSLEMRIDDSSYILRVGDQGGGIVNRIVNRFLGPVSRFYPVREFLTYQFCLRAIMAE